MLNLELLIWLLTTLLINGKYVGVNLIIYDKIFELQLIKQNPNIYVGFVFSNEISSR